MARGLARCLAGLLVCIGLFATAGPAGAAPADVSFSATLNGRSVSAISSNDPLKLTPRKPLVVALSVTNRSGKAVTVSAARVQGRVMGLSFFSYDTQVALKVPAGSTQKTTFSIGLADLAGQADGLLPTSIALLDTNSASIASKDFSVDVQGKLTSIYGVFGLAVAALTALWLISLIYRVARRSLPANRWSRAVQFAVAGFGVGLTLTFTVSALSLLTPNAAVWAPFVFGAGAVGLAIGYLTPGPRVADPDEEEQFIASRPPAYAGGLGAGSAAPAIGAGDQEALEPQRPWQGEIERTPLGQRSAAELPEGGGEHRAGDGVDDTAPGSGAQPVAPADADTQDVPPYPPPPSPSATSARDDRETTELDGSDSQGFYRGDDRPDTRS